jgi:hypothetical protein
MIRRAAPITPVAVALALALAARARGADEYTEPPLKPTARDHWAFRPPARPAVPKTQFPTANPIDHFVRARLERAGLKPAPPADKLTLLRRVTLDLTGLPPTPAEVDAFLKDAAPDAYEKLVERLLASPHHGERWATHWLDVVRFAESNGYEADTERPHAWRYRDYVAKSFNDDKPYDRFVREQLAGDELAGPDAGAKAELLVATGMHRCGPVHRTSGNLDRDVYRQEVLTEMVNGVGATFLGLTFACCRCHDHKFDALSAADYYRLQAYFAGATYADVDFATPAERAAYDARVKEIAAQAAPLRKRIAELDAPVRDTLAKRKRDDLEPRYRDALDTPAEKRSAAERTLAAHAATLIKVSWDEILAAMPSADLAKRTALRARLHAIEAQTPAPPAAAWAIRDTNPAAKTFVLKRGDVQRPTLRVTPGVARVLASDPAPEPKSRRELADWLTPPDHPLTARVIVNRLWQHHFGRGIVATPNDFGVRGERPTHPELLDWLACELTKPASQRPGAAPAPWGLKHIHRLIVTSATYRQSATADHGAKQDPDNKLLWKMSRRRLEAEAIRDSILTAAGTLNREVGGPSVKVPLEPEVYDLIFTEGEPDGLWPVTPDARQHARRSVYLFGKRNVRLPMLEAFDQPDTLNSCAVRPVSTFAPQALILMNSPFVHAQGKALAAALVTEVGADADKQLTALYRRAVGREPTAAERELAAAFLTGQADVIRAGVRANRPAGIDAGDLPEGTDVARVRALADLCVVLFNTHEFVYIP